jgi:hypothetical protein
MQSCSLPTLGFLTIFVFAADFPQSSIREHVEGMSSEHNPSPAAQQTFDQSASGRYEKKDPEAFARMKMAKDRAFSKLQRGPAGKRRR